MIPFDDITALRLHKSRYKGGQSLYRLEAVRVSQKTFDIIRDVSHPEPLYSLGKKMGKMSRIPFEAPDLEEKQIPTIHPMNQIVIPCYPTL